MADLKLLNSVIAKYRDFPVANRSMICSIPNIISNIPLYRFIVSQIAPTLHRFKELRAYLKGIY